MWRVTRYGIAFALGQAAQIAADEYRPKLADDLLLLSKTLDRLAIRIARFSDEVAKRAGN